MIELELPNGVIVESYEKINNEFSHKDEKMIMPRIAGHDHTNSNVLHLFTEYVEKRRVDIHIYVNAPQEIISDILIQVKGGDRLVKGWVKTPLNRKATKDDIRQTAVDVFKYDPGEILKQINIRE
jgi:hypothetical protein